MRRVRPLVRVGVGLARKLVIRGANRENRRWESGCFVSYCMAK